MTRRPTAVVKRCTPSRGGQWILAIQAEGARDETFAMTPQPHPEGTRLTLVDGEWRKL